MIDKDFGTFKPIKDAVLPRPKHKKESPRIEVQDQNCGGMRKIHSLEENYDPISRGRTKSLTKLHAE
jgi:hypothetical protein